MRALFMGTPVFATATLEAMLGTGMEVAGVITQPDRPAGRGQQASASPVKKLALERGLAVHQPARIRHADAVALVEGLQPEVIVVVGYGQILPRAIFGLPRLGAINVHASLLPKYRGAAPIQWAIANGETVTGVTIQQIDEGLDTGDVLAAREVAIGPEETAPELGGRLARAGADLLVETLAAVAAGNVKPVPQDAALATYAPVLGKEDGRVDWRLPAQQIANRARGFDPWPGAYTTFRGQLVHLRRVRALEGEPGEPGTLAVAGHALRAACGRGWLELLELQPEGKKRMTAGEFINGRRPASGEKLGV